MPLTKITTDNIDFSSNLVFSNVYSVEVTSHLAVNSTIIANTTGTFATHLGGASHTSFVQNTDSRTLSGNLSFTGTNVAFSSNTAVTLPIGTTAQRPTGAAGMLRYNANTGKFEGYGSSWGNIGGGAATGDTPPANPGAGDLWWSSADGRMYVYYADANTSQWVDISAAGAGQYLSIAGGTVTGNVTVTGDLTVTKTQAAVSITSSGNANPYVAFNAPSLNTTYIFVDKAGAGQLVADNAYGHVWNTSGTERMRIDASGRVTTPYQPMVYANKTNGSYTNTTAVVTWNTVSINVGNHYDSGTGRFTAPVTGYYLVQANWIIGNGGAGGAAGGDTTIRKNGVAYVAAHCNTSEIWDNQSIQAVIYLIAGDYVDIYVNANATSVSIWYGGGYNGFTVRLLG